MALINSNYEFSGYVDDFGQSYFAFPLKFGDDIPIDIIETMGYTLRNSASVTCGGSGKLFDLRYLEVTLTTGAIHKLPVNRSEIIAKRDALLALNVVGGAVVCVNLVGESWNLVPPSRFPDDAPFRSTPYTNIPSRSQRNSYRYSYDSDIFSGTVQLSTSIESLPDELNSCQIDGLTDSELVGGGICSGAGLGISPRKWIIQAIATKEGDPATKLRRVTRQMISSTRVSSEILQLGEVNAECAYCYGYKGESVRGLEAI